MITLKLNKNQYYDNTKCFVTSSFKRSIWIIANINCCNSSNRSNSSNKNSDISMPQNQTNKVINVSMSGGLIGLFSASPLTALNNKILSENTNGWKVVQVIPADSGNIFLYIFRFLLLIFCRCWLTQWQVI